jgi:hypothetical protein
VAHLAALPHPEYGHDLLISWQVIWAVARTSCSFWKRYQWTVKVSCLGLATVFLLPHPGRILAVPVAVVDAGLSIEEIFAHGVVLVAVRLLVAYIFARVVVPQTGCGVANVNRGVFCAIVP